MKIHNSEEINRDCIGNSNTSVPTPPSYSFVTNWTITAASLEDSIFLETSDSPIHANYVNFTKKTPLVLKPPTSDTAPCEITLTFSQKHEIRQIYVRSTARVYEIYYKPAVHSSNEYLCTVRCGIAAREDELHHVSDNEEAVVEPTKESDGELSKKKSPSSANEDDWVEVKNPESPVEVINSLPEDIIGAERSLQDFYEATAEISDAEPCVTLILRLLSLENKGCVYVDEVYVYTDPVESTDLENQAGHNLQGGTSVGSSLMTMFLPTLLHLTRSNVGQLQDKHSSNKMVEGELTDKGRRKNDSTSNLNEQDKRSTVSNWKDAKLQEDQEVTAQAATQFQIPGSLLEKEGQYHSVADCNNHVGRVMEQLISRMGRIEDLCLRFEEKMVRPINSMEERLQRVESQLEIIVKNSQYSEPPSCTRFSAPAFSSLDSTSSSFCNDDFANPPCVQSEVEKHENPFNDISKSEETSKSGRDPQFIPSYVVMAPEFSCDEDDDQNDVAEPLKDFPCEKPKKPLSIDDALAAALAGFSSMTISDTIKSSERVLKFTNKENGTDVDLIQTQSIVRAPESTIEINAGEEPSKYTQGLKVTAPDFESEDTSYDDKVASPRMKYENLVPPSVSFATDGGENTLDSISALSSTGSVLEKDGTKKVHIDDGIEQFFEDHIDVMGTTISSPSVLAKDEFIKDNYLATGETSAQKCRSSEHEVLILDRFELVKQLLAKTKDGAGTAETVSGSYFKYDERGSDKDFKYDERGSVKDISSSLDFETPILEVKFTPWETSSSRLPLEALLTDPELEAQTSFVPKSNDGEITTKASDLSSAKEERITLQRNNLFLVDLESYDAPVSSENAAGHQDPLSNKEQEIFSSLI